jgi:hypothetical protein
LAYQRPPELSNQLRWPPMDVVQRTVHGFAANSSYGTAASGAI